MSCLTLAIGGARPAAAATAVGAIGVAADVARDAARDPVAAEVARVVEAGGELWLAVRVNGSPAERPARLWRNADGRLFASATDFARWRLRQPAADAAPVRHKGKEYLPLDGVPGLRYTIDQRDQALLLDGLPSAFVLTTVAPARPAAYNDPAVQGGFLNYDLSGAVQGGRRTIDGLFEAGLSSQQGFGGSTFLAHLGDGKPRAVRLDTSWTRDDAAGLAALTLGDAVSRPGAWGRAVRFGGLQWGRNFALRPEFVPFPLPTLRGEAALPSTVDLYVDNALRLSRNVPNGPFEIPRAPVLAGDGELRLVVRDVLGREVVLSQSYTVSAGLLEPGLHDYRYEAGKLRRRYAQESNDYGDFFAAGTHRLGLSARMTGEVRGEWMAGQQTLGLAASYLVPSLGLASVAAALSHRREGNGTFWSLGLERQSRPFSFGVEIRGASAAFAELGGGPDNPEPARRELARASLASGRSGSFFVSWLRQVDHHAGQTRLFSAGYTVGLADRLQLSVFALRAFGSGAGNGVALNLTYAFGDRGTASASLSRNGGAGAGSLQLQQGLPSGSGYGYRLAAEDGPLRRSEAALLARSQVGSYSLEALRVGELTGYRASASGSLAFLGGELFAARRIDDSFALVDVADYDGVNVYLDNQPVAKTRHGRALVTGLRPYQSNSLSLRADELPLDAEVSALRLGITPPRRSAGRLSFPVRPARGALLRIVLDDGAPLPAGAWLSVDGSADEFPVGKRGEAYVKGLAAETRLTGHWRGQRCALDVALPAQAGPLPVLGPLVCAGVRQ